MSYVEFLFWSNLYASWTFIGTFSFKIREHSSMIYWKMISVPFTWVPSFSTILFFNIFILIIWVCFFHSVPDSTVFFFFNLTFSLTEISIPLFYFSFNLFSNSLYIQIIGPPLPSSFLTQPLPPFLLWEGGGPAGYHSTLAHQISAGLDRASHPMAFQGSQLEERNP